MFFISKTFITNTRLRFEPKQQSQVYHPPPSTENFPPLFFSNSSRFVDPFFKGSNKNSIFPCIQSSGNFPTSGNLCFRVFTYQLIVINKCVSFRTEKKLIKFIKFACTQIKQVNKRIVAWKLFSCIRVIIWVHQLYVGM